MSNLLRLIKRHEGFRAAPYWDKTGQEMWQGLDPWIAGPDDVESKKAEIKKELGHLTIGYGFNLEAPRSEEFWRYVLEWDVGQATAQADKYKWFRELNPDWGHLPDFEEMSARQGVIISMIYQLGPTGFAGFKRMIENIQTAIGLETFGWAAVADEMLDSKWARQTPERARELAEMMCTGEWPSWMSEAA